MVEVSASAPCPGCGAAVFAEARFCQACGRALARDGEPTRAQMVRGFVEGAFKQADEGARAVLRNPRAQKVAGGAVLGAGVAVFVPFVTMAAGATLGAAYVGYKLLTRD